MVEDTFSFAGTFIFKSSSILCNSGNETHALTRAREISELFNWNRQMEEQNDSLISSHWTDVKMYLEIKLCSGGKKQLNCLLQLMSLVPLITIQKRGMNNFGGTLVQIKKSKRTIII